MTNLKQMRSFRTAEGSTEELNEVLILIRICHIYGDPQFYFFINPWKLFLNGRLTFQGSHEFQGRILKYPPMTKQRSTTATCEGRARNGEPSTMNSWAIPFHPRDLKISHWTALGSRAPMSIVPREMYEYCQLPLSKSGEYLPINNRNIPQAYCPVYNHTAPDCSLGAPQWQACDQLSYAQAHAVPLSPVTTNTKDPYWSTMNSSISKLAITGPNQGARELAISMSHSAISNQISNLPSIYSQNSLPSWDTLTDTRRHDHDQYVYQKLEKGAIRLFTLFPGESHEELRGLICTVPFSQAGSYKALSYTWGPPAQVSHKVLTPEGCISIRESLCSSLVRLRPKDNTLILWVDAICINQADNKEKAKQIRLLPEIFQKATNTLAFLGSDERSDAALEVLMQINANRKYRPDLDNWPKNLPKMAASWQETGIPPNDDPIWSEVETLFNRQWFRRAWIVQEAVASPVVTIVCGKWMVNCDDLFAAIRCVNERLQLSRNVDSASWDPFLKLAIQRSWEAKHARWSLFLLLETFRHVDSSLNRDRFFSLLGLASDGNLEAFEPDYESPFEDIACRVAGTLITQERGIQVLSRAGLGSQPHRFPSWIPDWTTAKSGSLSDSLGRGVKYNASGDETEEIQFVPGTKEVHVKAIMADHITNISRSFNEPKQPKKLGRYLQEVDTMIDSLSNNYTSVERDILKWLVPIAGALHPKVAVSGFVDTHESYKATRRILKKAEHMSVSQSKKRLLRIDDIVSKAEASPELEEMSVREKSLSYISLLEDCIEGWRFVTTKHGRCGIVPANAEVGDRVAIFLGGDVPFIVRPGIEKEACFRLVGECYIHGVMQGAIVNDKSIIEILRLY